MNLYTLIYTISLFSMAFPGFVICRDIASDEAYAQEKARRERYLLASPCGTEYESLCPEEPVISGRKAVYNCLMTQKISPNCKAFIREVAPELVESPLPFAPQIPRQNQGTVPGPAAPLEENSQWNWYK